MAPCVQRWPLALACTSALTLERELVAAFDSFCEAVARQATRIDDNSITWEPSPRSHREQNKFRANDNDTQRSGAGHWLDLVTSVSCIELETRL
jgi:hypothetical protein